MYKLVPISALKNRTLFQPSGSLQARRSLRDLSRGPVVKNPPVIQGHGLDPDRGNQDPIWHGAPLRARVRQLESPRAATET